MSYNYIPPSTIEKIEKFGKSFNDLTIETVKGFLIDSKKSNFNLFNFTKILLQRITHL